MFSQLTLQRARTDKWQFPDMDPLFKKVLLRTLLYLLFLLPSAWLFLQVEYTEEDEEETKYQVLHSLQEFMISKYNITTEEFINFSHIAHEALSDPKPKWTFSSALDFVFPAWSTIGKKGRLSREVEEIFPV